MIFRIFILYFISILLLMFYIIVVICSCYILIVHFCVYLFQFWTYTVLCRICAIEKYRLVLHLYYYSKTWLFVQNCVVFFSDGWALLRGGLAQRVNQCRTATAPHVIQDVYAFLSSGENKLRFLIKTFLDFYPYSELQWTPNGWRSKLQF